jgi:hypothetical protein
VSDSLGCLFPLGCNKVASNMPTLLVTASMDLATVLENKPIQKTKLEIFS